MDLRTTIVKTLLGEQITSEDVLLESDLPQEHKDIIKNQGIEGYEHFLRNEKLKKQPTKKHKLDVLSQWRQNKKINAKQYAKHIDEL